MKKNNKKRKIFHKLLPLSVIVTAIPVVAFKKDDNVEIKQKVNNLSGIASLGKSSAASSAAGADAIYPAKESFDFSLINQNSNDYKIKFSKSTPSISPSANISFEWKDLIDDELNDLVTKLKSASDSANPFGFTNLNEANIDDYISSLGELKEKFELIYQNLDYLKDNDSEFQTNLNKISLYNSNFNEITSYIQRFSNLINNDLIKMINRYKNNVFAFDKVKDTIDQIEKDTTLAGNENIKNLQQNIGSILSEKSSTAEISLLTKQIANKSSSIIPLAESVKNSLNTLFKLEANMIQKSKGHPNKKFDEYIFEHKNKNIILNLSDKPADFQSNLVKARTDKLNINYDLASKIIEIDLAGEPPESNKNFIIDFFRDQKYSRLVIDINKNNLQLFKDYVANGDFDKIFEKRLIFFSSRLNNGDPDFDELINDLVFDYDSSSSKLSVLMKNNVSDKTTLFKVKSNSKSNKHIAKLGLFGVVKLTDLSSNFKFSQNYVPDYDYTTQISGVEIDKRLKDYQKLIKINESEKIENFKAQELYIPIKEYVKMNKDEAFKIDEISIPIIYKNGLNYNAEKDSLEPKYTSNNISFSYDGKKGELNNSSKWTFNKNVLSTSERLSTNIHLVPQLLTPKTPDSIPLMRIMIIYNSDIIVPGGTGTKFDNWSPNKPENLTNQSWFQKESSYIDDNYANDYKTEDTNTISPLTVNIKWESSLVKNPKSIFALAYANAFEEYKKDKIPVNNSSYALSSPINTRHIDPFLGDRYSLTNKVFNLKTEKLNLNSGNFIINFEKEEGDYNVYQLAQKLKSISKDLKTFASRIGLNDKSFADIVDSYDEIMGLSQNISKQESSLYSEFVTSNQGLSTSDVDEINKSLNFANKIFKNGITSGDKIELDINASTLSDDLKASLKTLEKGNVDKLIHWTFNNVTSKVLLSNFKTLTDSFKKALKQFDKNSLRSFINNDKKISIKWFKDQLAYENIDVNGKKIKLLVLSKSNSNEIKNHSFADLSENLIDLIINNTSLWKDFVSAEHRDSLINIYKKLSADKINLNESDAKDIDLLINLFAKSTNLDIEQLTLKENQIIIKDENYYKDIFSKINDALAAKSNKSEKLDLKNVTTLENILAQENIKKSYEIYRDTKEENIKKIQLWASKKITDKNLSLYDYVSALVNEEHSSFHRLTNASLILDKSLNETVKEMATPQAMKSMKSIYNAPVDFITGDSQLKQQKLESKKTIDTIWSSIKYALIAVSSILAIIASYALIVKRKVFRKRKKGDKNEN